LLVDRERSTLAGRYRLDEILAGGGMSTVYRASDLLLDRVVAVKVLPAPVAEQRPESVTRFAREARAAASLSDPGIVAVHDFGVEAGVHFIVMEYVRGESLATVLSAQGALDPGRAVMIAERVAGALAAAHKAGIVHRDIKPANVMLADDGRVKVLDFGIARQLDDIEPTRTASLLGTAGYIAPERIAGAPADARSDIYSLGCVLYAMLAGQPPFGGDALATILERQAHATPPRLRGVGEDLASLVEQMLAKSPRARPQDAAAVRERLAQIAVPTTRLLPAVDPAPTLRMPRARAPHPTTRGARAGARRRAAAALLGVALAAMIVVLSSASGGAQRLTLRGTQASARSPEHRASTHRSLAGATTTAGRAQLVGQQVNGPTAGGSGPTGPSPASVAQPPAPPGHGGLPPGLARKLGDQAHGPPGQRGDGQGD
jgi:serine/threonine protein kinase